MIKKITHTYRGIKIEGVPTDTERYFAATFAFLFKVNKPYSVVEALKEALEYSDNKKTRSLCSNIARENQINNKELAKLNRCL